MRKLLSLLVLLSVAGCGKKQQETAFNTYGAEVSSQSPISLSALEDNIAQGDSSNFIVKATIEETCSKKGCWMTVDDGSGKKIRVTFKDYGFFVPTNGAEGKEVVFAGVARRKVTDVATLQHFAKDAGKSQEEIEAITTPKEEIEFVADGVIIFESEKEGAK